MALSNYLVNKILLHTLGGSAYSAPATTYLALFSANPMADFSGSGNEIATGGYARQAISWGAIGSDTSAATDAQIEFPVASAAQSSPTHYGIMDALTSGNLLWFGETSGESAAAEADQFIVTIGNLTATLS